MPGAIGAARESGVSGSSQQLQQARTIAAGQLRQTLASQQEQRASRLRDAQSTMVAQVQVAAEKERAGPRGGPAQVGHPGRRTTG